MLYKDDGSDDEGNNFLFASHQLYLPSRALTPLHEVNECNIAFLPFYICRYILTSHLHKYCGDNTH